MKRQADIDSKKNEYLEGIIYSRSEVLGYA